MHTYNHNVNYEQNHGKTLFVDCSDLITCNQQWMGKYMLHQLNNLLTIHITQLHHKLYTLVDVKLMNSIVMMYVMQSLSILHDLFSYFSPVTKRFMRI